MWQRSCSGNNSTLEHGGFLVNVKLRKLSDQVIVITGASSGIGLVSARLAAKRSVSANHSDPGRSKVLSIV
jgi:NADPH:quinone reductase-like Zn-dependent oxidoreductase